MRCLQLLFVFWCFSILAVTSCIRVDRKLCVSDYWNTITCVLDISNDSVGQSNATYSLKFGNKTSCPLVVMNGSYSCVCKVTDSFSSVDEYDIELCHESGCDPVEKEFSPSLNIHPTPPHQVEVQQTEETLNITWKSGYENHRFLRSGVLTFELLLQTENNAHHLESNQEFTSIPRSQLKPDATYCIKVKSKATKRYYVGSWSKWSLPTCWKNEAGEEQDNTLLIVIKSLGPLCVAVGVLLFVFCSPTARLKIKHLSHTPSPAPFFQPLFQQHQGNLQEWLSPGGTFVLTYQTEELLTTEAVFVVPKPTTKDPEENQDVHNPPTVTQLAFPQCPTSYVGLPGSHEPPQPVTMVCPGNLSYTRLPCPVWDVAVAEVEVDSSPPKDFFNISRTDSGCEEPTQSPECSLPNSPVDESPPPCYCTDYCILNKTAQGFAPVLVSKGNNQNVSSDSLQEDESLD